MRALAAAICLAYGRGMNPTTRRVTGLIIATLAAALLPLTGAHAGTAASTNGSLTIADTTVAIRGCSDVQIQFTYHPADPAARTFGVLDVFDPQGDRVLSAVIQGSETAVLERCGYDPFGTYSAVLTWSVNHQQQPGLSTTFVVSSPAMDTGPKFSGDCVTKAEYRKIRMGYPRAKVERIFGEQRSWRTFKRGRIETRVYASCDRAHAATITYLRDRVRLKDWNPAS